LRELSTRARGVYHEKIPPVSGIFPLTF